ncbi:putative oxidoreductase YulF [Clostridia bacterium]|nr:putative oxidoreductase YulF [Clostridia bacterium]
MNFAVIGTNFVTDWFLDAAANCPDFTLAAIYSRTEERAREYAKRRNAENVKFFTSLDELARDKSIDAVYVASPISEHCGQVITLLDGGKHVLCEKPVAQNSRELRRMFDAAARNKVVLLEAMRPAFLPALTAIRESMTKIGKIRHASILFCQYSSRYDRFKAGERINAFNPELGGGALTDLGVYCIQVCLYLFGVPKAIHSVHSTIPNSIDGTGVISARYGEMTADLIFSKVSDTHNFSEIQGEDGTVRFRNPNDLAEVYILRRGEKDFTPVEFEKSEHDMIYELNTFVSAAKNPKNAEYYNNYSIETVKIIEEVKKL